MAEIDPRDFESERTYGGAIQSGEGRIRAYQKSFTGKITFPASTFESQGGYISAKTALRDSYE